MTPEETELLKEIKSTLGKTITPSLPTKPGSSDLYEAYAFCLVVEAAKVEGAAVEYRDPTDNVANSFVFRTSPGFLWSQTHSYTFAYLEFPGARSLEVHSGVRVQVKSGVLHEFDVCVLKRAECGSRSGGIHSRSSQMIIGIECKFYSSGLSLGLGREFIGLGADVTAKNTVFISNQSSASVEQLFSGRSRNWGTRIEPGAQKEVEMIRNQFQTTFRDYKARA